LESELSELIARTLALIERVSVEDPAIAVQERPAPPQATAGEVPVAQLEPTRNGETS
jgi:hypothetical protein